MAYEKESDRLEGIESIVVVSTLVPPITIHFYIESITENNHVIWDGYRSINFDPSSLRKAAYISVRDGKMTIKFQSVSMTSVSRTEDGNVVVY